MQSSSYRPLGFSSSSMLSIEHSASLRGEGSLNKRIMVLRYGDRIDGWWNVG
jgi:hypothetical protein